MTQREKLIELLKSPHKAERLREIGVDIGAYQDDCIEAMIADYLLANGVIVPPCKVGDTVYYIHEGGYRVYEGKVTNFIYVANKKSFGIHYDGGYGIFGRYVFLYREEAEKALAERSGK